MATKGSGYIQVTIKVVKELGVTCFFTTFNFEIIFMNIYKEVAVVDIFCGIGGLTHGFVLEGFKVTAGYDIDKSCEYAYVANNAGAKFVDKDIKDVTGAEVSAHFLKSKIKILIGCAPCQTFSRYTSGGREKKDGKWSLLNEFARLISEVQPDIISMENVPQLAKLDKNGVYSHFIESLHKNGYYVSDINRIAYCPEYGVPQKRKRLILLASKKAPINLIEPTHIGENTPTVRTALYKLPPIMDGEIHADDLLHRAQKLSILNKVRIKATKEGGSWREWPEELKLECHKKLKGSTFNDVYGRMVWDEPAPTLTTHCIGLSNGRFGHPEQHRAISLREASLLQSFPIDYKLANFAVNQFNSANLQRHIGNAVPVKLGQAIAKTIKAHIIANF